MSSGATEATANRGFQSERNAEISGKTDSRKKEKNQKERRKEKLNIAVYGFLQSYDPTLFFYRDSKKKNDAWRKVSDLVGGPGEL